MRRTRVRGTFRNVSLDDPEDLAIYGFLQDHGLEAGYYGANAEILEQALHAAKQQRNRGMLARLFDPTGWPVLRLFIGGREKNSPAIEQATLICQTEEQAEALYAWLHEQSGIAYRAERLPGPNDPF